MEKLMNRIVAKPNMIADDRLNTKIEKIFSVEIFQKMVENADIFQDLSSSSIFNQSEFLHRSSAGGALSFKKVLPTHSQLREEDDDNELPRFGNFDQFQQEKEEAERKQAEEKKSKLDVNDSVNELFAPLKEEEKKTNDHKLKQRIVQQDDSFSQGPVNRSSLLLGKSEGKGQEKQMEDMIQHMGKMPSMIQPYEGEASFFQNSQSFVFQQVEELKEPAVDDYNDDDDPGFEIYVVNEENFVPSCKELAQQYNFPARSIKPDTKESQIQRQKVLQKQ